LTFTTTEGRSSDAEPANLYIDAAVSVAAGTAQLRFLLRRADLLDKLFTGELLSLDNGFL